MTYPHGGPRDIWRDANAHSPQKGQIRDYLSLVQARLEAIYGSPVSGSLYETEAEGVAAVEDGALFGVVPSSASEIVQIYRRSGTSAVLVKTYPNPDRIEEAVTSAETAQGASAVSQVAAATSEQSATSSAAQAAALVGMSPALYQRQTYADALADVGTFTVGPSVYIAADEQAGGGPSLRLVTAGGLGDAQPLKPEGVYLTVDILKLSQETARGVGAVWRTDDGFSYQEADAAVTDHHLQIASGVKLYVLPINGSQYHTRAFGSVGGTNEDAIFQMALTAAAGKTLVISKVAAPVTGGNLIPAANTHLFYEPGVVYNVISGGTRGLQIAYENIHVYAYGATIVMDGSQNSHGCLVSGLARNCSVQGLKVVGAGNTGDDCFYIGGDPASNIAPENIRLVDCIGDGNARARSCLSVAVADGLLVEGCEFYGALTSPGLGVDVEANRFMADGTSATRNVLFRDCH